ncbi:retrotransposable element Tf2 protein type 1 [Trichonephila clavipes]|nr:retrotransposable element Tf2 protein type 1 [Trichonephila clavipes]
MIKHPLNQLLKKEISWKWTNECQESFEFLKQALICKPILKMFKPRNECQLLVNASLTGVGAVLKQLDIRGDLHPVAFHSRSLRNYEKIIDYGAGVVLHSRLFK